MPHELSIQGVFLPPFLIALLLASVATMLTARVLNRLRLGRYFALPRLVFLSFIGIYLVLIGTFMVRI
jgi:hypothetical protein